MFPKPFAQTSYFGVPRLGPVWSHDCVVGCLLLVEMSSRLEMTIVLVWRIRKLLNRKFALGFLLGMLLSACGLEIFRSDTAVDMASIGTMEQNKAGQWRRTLDGWELIRRPPVTRPRLGSGPTRDWYLHTRSFDSSCQSGQAFVTCVS